MIVGNKSLISGQKLASLTKSKGTVDSSNQKQARNTKNAERQVCRKKGEVNVPLWTSPGRERNSREEEKRDLHTPILKNVIFQSKKTNTTKTD